jgi:CheY-like chemotaxis protein
MNPYILLVEDSEDDIVLTQRALQKNHIANQLVIARDGEQALDILLRPGEGTAPAELPVLVLLDLKLPKVDGLQVLTELRKAPSTRRLPVVMLTTSTEERDVAAGYDSGVNSYIRKPVSFEQFVLAVGQVGVYWLMLNEPPPPPRSP